MEMLKTIRDARDEIERLGEYIGQQEKLARWGQPLKGLVVDFALELIAIRDLAKETESSLQVLQNDIAAMLETLKRTASAKFLASA
jgi:hypothetical protein